MSKMQRYDVICDWWGGDCEHEHCQPSKATPDVNGDWVDADEAEHTIAALKSDNARLQAAVDKLPKFKDGAPACSGDEAWHPNELWREESGQVMRDIDRDNCGYWAAEFSGERPEQDHIYRLEQCYSTRELAEAKEQA